MLRFQYKQITNNRQMGRRRDKSAIKFIVIHYTGNPSKGANAMAHYRYLQNATRYGSAHYFVDDSNIIQCIGDSIEAWAIGDNQGYGTALNGATNYNSVSIEMCVNSDGDFNKTLKNTIELTKELLRHYPNARVCRHWDVSRKDCPSGFTGNNNVKWSNFLSEIKKNREYIIDITKDSTAQLVGKEEVNNTRQGDVKVEKQKCVMFIKDGNEKTARFIAEILNIPCFRDNGIDLPKEKYNDYQILYVGDLGKDRIETARIAVDRFLK